MNYDPDSYGITHIRIWHDNCYGRISPTMQEHSWSADHATREGKMDVIFDSLCFVCSPGDFKYLSKLIEQRIMDKNREEVK